MPQQITQFALLVADYDEALAFYVGVLGFDKLEDTDLGGGKRWVRVRPAGSTGAGLLLARAVTDEQRLAIGRQAGGRVSSSSRPTTSDATTPPSSHAACDSFAA